MDGYTLSEVFDAVYKDEFSEFDKSQRHFFSLRHHRAMEELFYPRAAAAYKTSRKISLRKRVLIALLVILLSMIGIVAGAAVSQSFKFKERSEFTVVTAEIDQNAPIMIDDYYYLPEVPQGFELFFQDRSLTSSIFEYNDISGHIFFFAQSVKEQFYAYYISDDWITEELKINERPAIYFTQDGIDGTVIWDNEDYILKIGGQLPKDELIALAESVEIEA